MVGAEVSSGEFSCLARLRVWACWADGTLGKCLEAAPASCSILAYLLCAVPSIRAVRAGGGRRLIAWVRRLVVNTSYITWLTTQCLHLPVELAAVRICNNMVPVWNRPANASRACEGLRGRCIGHLTLRQTPCIHACGDSTRVGLFGTCTELLRTDTFLRYAGFPV